MSHFSETCQLFLTISMSLSWRGIKKNVIPPSYFGSVCLVVRGEPPHRPPGLAQFVKRAQLWDCAVA